MAGRGGEVRGLGEALEDACHRREGKPSELGGGGEPRVIFDTVGLRGCRLSDSVNRSIGTGRLVPAVRTAHLRE